MITISVLHLGGVLYLLALVGVLGRPFQFVARLPFMIAVIMFSFLLGPTFQRKNEENQTDENFGARDADERDPTRKTERPKRKWAIADMMPSAALNWAESMAEKSGAQIEPNEPFEVWVEKRKGGRG